jgi:hypothetical protein
LGNIDLLVDFSAENGFSLQSVGVVRTAHFSNISSSLKLLELISGIDETSTEFSSISYDKRVGTVKGYAL